jgi:hypothetical protein
MTKLTDIKEFRSIRRAPELPSSREPEWLVDFDGHVVWASWKNLEKYVRAQYGVEIGSVSRIP